MDSQNSEDSLIRQAIQGDRLAFTCLYDIHVDRIYRHVYYRLSNRDDAEDITQEVFIRAWKAIKRYRQTGVPFIAWLISIAHNLIVDYYRARKKSVLQLDMDVLSRDDEPSIEATLERKLKQEHIRNAISGLKDERQKVILMRFIDGLSYTEIARALNKSEGAIRVTLYRALNDLRRMLA